KALANNKAVSVTLVDRKNHHTFQPLLYQVATSVLSPGEIATPLRHILYRARNVEVILGDVTGFDLEGHNVMLDGGGELKFDYLVGGAGAPPLILRPRRLGARCSGTQNRRGRDRDPPTYLASFRGCRARGPSDGRISAAEFCDHRRRPDRCRTCRSDRRHR